MKIYDIIPIDIICNLGIHDKKKWGYNMRTEQIRSALMKKVFVGDGAMGTYYATKYDTQELPERANEQYPERISNIHLEYISAGADFIRTNTFASNTVMLQCDFAGVRRNIEKACKIARDIAGNHTYIAGDIGPIRDGNRSFDEITEEYVDISRVFIEQNVDIILFETFSNMDEILPAIEYIQEHTDAFVVVQFTVNQFGYSNAGLSARKLIEQAIEHKGVHATGFNCGVGPGHLYHLMNGLELENTDTFITAFPNAGYPQNIGNRMLWMNDNKSYFAEKSVDFLGLGVDLIGGCCGTTPEYISKMAGKLTRNRTKTFLSEAENMKAKTAPIKKTKKTAFYEKKLMTGEKFIAVELAPPLGSDDKQIMEAAHSLKKSGVDVLTFPDSPSGRTRADAVLMAEKVERETGICVMPHLCCRDKNAIAIRSQLLGAHINHINNFLVITGDPIPSVMRQSVKSVFNFDSVGLMNIINDMNTEQFPQAPLTYGGAINHTRRNLDVEIMRVKKKMQAGATFFFTQPAFSKEDVDRIRMIKEETGARILCGIMPLVSYRNAMFMKNEMTGIHVTEEVLAKYPKEGTKQEGEAVGVSIAKEVIEMTKDFVEGYYFSFPFNRVYLLDQILK